MACGEKASGDTDCPPSCEHVHWGKKQRIIMMALHRAAETVFANAGSRIRASSAVRPFSATSLVAHRSGKSRSGTWATVIPYTRCTKLEITRLHKTTIIRTHKSGARRLGEQWRMGRKIAMHRPGQAMWDSGAGGTPHTTASPIVPASSLEFLFSLVISASSLAEKHPHDAFTFGR